MKICSFLIFVSLPALGCVSFPLHAAEPLTQHFTSFADLVASVSQPPPQEKMDAAEQARLTYCVTPEAVRLRQSLIVDKAAILSPSKKPNGKHSLGIDLARLEKNPKDSTAWANVIQVAPWDGKDAHFTKMLLAFLYGRYRDTMPPEVKKALEDQAQKFTEFFGSGTENHFGMQRVAAMIFGAAHPNLVMHGGLTGREVEQKATDWIQRYGQAVFARSMREYLSLIYLGVHNEIWLTAGQYGPTEETRRMGSAMLDWIWSDLALNSHLGVVIPPVTRAKTMLDRSAQTLRPVTHVQWMAWMYWGDTLSRSGKDELTPEAKAIGPHSNIDKMKESLSGFGTAIPAAISPLVPNDIIRNLGAKNIALPYMALQSRVPVLPLKGAADGVKMNPDDFPSAAYRSVYVARDYAIGTGYFEPEDEKHTEGYSHVFPTAVTYRSADEFNSLIITHPYWYAGPPHGNDGEAAKVFGLDCWLGQSPFEQSVHWENTLIKLFDIPDTDPRVHEKASSKVPAKWTDSRLANPLKNACVYVPLTIDETREMPWGWFLREGDVYIALRVVGAEKSEWETCKNEVQLGYKRLVLTGSLIGLIVEAGDAKEYGSAEKFMAKIASAPLDLTKLAANQQLRYTSTRGIPFRLRFDEKSWLPDAEVKGVNLDFSHWPVCESPYVTSRKGVLDINDGRKGLTVDWSGTEPKYGNYDVAKNGSKPAR